MEKYIPLDPLLAELKRLIAELIREGEGTMFEQGRISAFEDATLFIDTLEVKEVDTWHLQEKEDIYDAAKYCIPDESYHMIIESKEEGSSENVYDYVQMIYMFKAGANWKEQQMIANAIDGNVIEDIEEGNGDFLLSTEYLPKSMGLKDGQKVKVIVIKEK